MAPTSPKIPSVVDSDKLFDDGVKLAATVAAGDAIMAEIEARQYELLVSWTPDRAESDVRDRAELTAKMAAERRRRADGLGKRAKISKPTDYTVDFRVFVGAQFHAAQGAQIMLDEKLNNIELYAVSADEARDMSNRMQPGMPPPETAGQIKLNALQNRARVQALFEWLDAHKTEGPAEIVDGPDTSGIGADVVRQLLGQKPAATSAPSSDDGGNEPAPEPKP
jgi:hypothetical protein